MRKYAWLLLPFLVACNESIRLDWKIPLNAGSVSTPLVTKDYIALGTDKGLVVTETDGSFRCKFEQAGTVVSAPATDGKLIFFGSTNYLAYALDPQCKEIWTLNTGDRIKSDPLVHEGRVYFTSYDGYIYALDTQTGKEVWTFPKKDQSDSNNNQFEVEEAETAAVAEPEKVADPAPDAAVAPADAQPAEEAVAAAEGGATPEEETPAKQGSQETGSFSYSSPTIFEKTLYVGNLDHRLYAINIEDGSMLWRFKTDAPVTSSPRVVDGTLYFGSNDGNVYSIDSRKIRVNWKSKTQHWVNSSALILGERLYIGSNDKNLYAFNLKSGRAVWKHGTYGDVISIPAPYKNLIIMAGGSGDGRIYAVEERNGRLFWSYKTGGKIESDPVIVGDKLFVSSTDGYLYSFTILKTQSK